MSVMADHNTQQTGPAGLAESMLSMSDDCIKILSLEGAVEGMNPAGIALMQLDDFEAVRGGLWWEFWPEHERAKVRDAVTRAGAGEVTRFSGECPTAKGVLKSWQVTVSPVYDQRECAIRLVAISRDVSRLAQAEQATALLAQEMAHRLKNMFALMDGVVGLTAREAPPEALPVVNLLRSRMRAIASAVRYLEPADESKLEDPTLLGLLHILLEPFGDRTAGGQVTVEGDDVPIGRLATTSVALLAHELATNAVKHGALSTPEGQVKVAVTRSGSDVGLHWIEHTVGASGEGSEDHGGVGASVIDNAVARQLCGTVVREWRADGLAVHIHADTEHFSQ